ncbi:hypothetical protein NBRC3280_1068 [Acetobacter pasteurianus NBRC 3280]|uniref:Uncharacterized protein n=2 Tax=Acetobacter pasteurianus TaxID=438 RepID=A0AAC9SLJ5_ACEPA|nr:hypothetical protein S101468_00022 [Acetobacter pasteurianus subsp. pasteurianus]GCD58566.1 hypothetical protein NBRC3277_1141 [Acetobacter pasteurianus NBRC 3277]GCD62056.1 hypothetical protein NBRC3278_1149 [Acetobacter pasteurianus NBRC 3278]GCD65677.1 hypothetical protein NBRC3279_1168 [Acetobacter pasteurianus NBRC 3279]GCD68433.1 hypothetical protein NBRC3280_1068 [Acetobacter pasteurianus NBRC 3280]GCD71987.1 hypothetical protein NBRC3284_1143 [Acetobacter pasteurianus NBRC 3284]
MLIKNTAAETDAGSSTYVQITEQEQEPAAEHLLAP